MRDEKLFWTQVVFLALTIWREASNQPHGTKVAVGYSILNRVERPSWWGTDLLSVLFKRWQYSSLTAPGDPNLVRWPLPADPSWLDSMAAAEAVLDRTEPNPFPGADSYFDESITSPTWATPDKYCGRSGAFYFYNVDMDHEASVTGPGAAAGV